VKKGKVSVGFWDGVTPAMRVGLYGFCGAAVSMLVGVLATYLNSNWLSYVAFIMMLTSVGIGIWGLVFLKHG
jgi:hypothetical protein